MIIKSILISISGALAPGPFTAAAASLGTKRRWKAGLEISFGHTLVVILIILLISLGLINFLRSEKLHLFLRIFSSFFLFLFGILIIKDAINYNSTITIRKKLNFPLLTGVSFIIWWLGIGTPLIYKAIKKSGFIGLLILYIFHVSLDYFWLIFIATLSSFYFGNCNNLFLLTLRINLL